MSTALPIGDFARATHLSVKTLRHYHRLGLLEPAEVDPSTGYRRYTVDQIPTAQVIRRFRDLDMPLDQIGEVLTAPDRGSRHSLIAAHLGRLEDGLVRTQSAVASLRHLLESSPETSPIAHRIEPPTDAAVISAVIDLADLSPWFQGAIGELTASLPPPPAGETGPPGALVATELFTDERGEVTVYIPVGRPFRAVGRVQVRTIPGAELAVIRHDGSHDDIDRSYGALAAHVADRAIGVEGPIRERYLIGRRDTLDENAWRTEIAWPVFATGPG